MNDVPAAGEGTAPEGAETPIVRHRPELAGWFALGLLALVWAWWGSREGAWFGVVFLPGAMLLCAGAALLAWTAPRRVAGVSAPAAIALVALLALAAWAALSALWSPAPDVAIADGQRIAVYALCFGLGLWLALLLGARAQLALVPLAVAGAFAGVLATVGMITTDTPRDLFELGGTLEYPIGYRNANAAFFVLAFFPAVGLASTRDLDWRLRGLALAAATLCLGLAMLSQSRGSVPAALVGILAYLVFSPLRLRAICWLALAALPAAGVIAPLTDLFRAVNDLGLRGALPEVETAGIAVAWTTGVALALGLLAARFERYLPGLGSTSRRANRPIGAAGAIVAFVVAVGDPVDWTVTRADEFRGGTPDLTQEATRFTFNVSTDRYDLWRVAVDDARAEPLRGTGAGGFEYSYLRERETRVQTARDAHSVQLEVLGELGIPGLVLLALALGGGAWGALRAWRFDVRAAGLSAIALSAFAYWLAHASIDWFWAYPALTAPLLALLGSAGATALAPAPGGRGLVSRHLPAAAAIVLAVTLLPPLMSERYVDDAASRWQADVAGAYRDLDRARALNPLTDEPLLVEGAIADAAGEPRRAVAALRAATEKRPENWAGYFMLAEILADQRPAQARRELERARELNPASLEIEALEARLDEEAGG